MVRRPKTYSEFWPFYLGEHSRSGTRALHLCGTLLGLILLLAAVVASEWRFVPAAIAAGYAFAWIGHVLIERNWPATLKYPLWSFISDFRMLGLWLNGRLNEELKRHGVNGSGPEPPAKIP